MKYFITGAAGFIGSAVSSSLAIAGNTVIGIDNFSDYYSKELKKQRVNDLLLPVGVRVMDYDVSEYDALSHIIQIEKPDFVLHFAAQAGVRIPLNQTQKYIKSNLEGFANVLQVIVENEIPDFIYSSSSSVYGDFAKIPFSEMDLNLRPNSFYGATKLSNELLTPTLLQGSKTRARGIRLFTVYGPWGRPDMAYFRILTAALKETEFDLFGDGNVERDFTYIEDVVSIVLKLSENLQNKDIGFHDICNIGGGRPLSINYLIEEIAKVTSMPINVQRKSRNHGDSVKTMADSNYLESLIGIHAFTSLENGLEKFYNWCAAPKNFDQLEDWVKSTK